MAHEVGDGVALARPWRALHEHPTLSIDRRYDSFLLAVSGQWEVDLGRLLPSCACAWAVRVATSVVRDVLDIGDQSTPAGGDIDGATRELSDQLVVYADHSGLSALAKDECRGEADGGRVAAARGCLEPFRPHGVRAERAGPRLQRSVHLRLVPDCVADLLDLRIHHGILRASRAKFGLQHVVFDPKPCAVAGSRYPDHAVGGVELELYLRHQHVPANWDFLVVELGPPVQQP